MIFSATEHYETLLTVLVNTSTGGLVMVRALITSFERSDNLYNDRDVYLIILIGQGTISRWIGWFRGEVFKYAERCVMVKFVLVLLMPVWNALYLPNFAATKKCKYEEVCFKG